MGTWPEITDADAQYFGMDSAYELEKWVNETNNTINAEKERIVRCIMDEDTEMTMEERHRLADSLEALIQDWLKRMATLIGDRRLEGAPPWARELVLGYQGVIKERLRDGR